MLNIVKSNFKIVENKMKFDKNLKYYYQITEDDIKIIE